MLTVLRREFEVNLRQAEAWRHLARVEDWPSWAKHIKRIELDPRGGLGPRSAGTIHLRNGIKSTFRMVEFNPHENWKWSGRFLWLKVAYDHVFEAQGARTRLIWIVECGGWGRSVLGRLFAWLYNKNLDKAIPALIEEMHSRVP